MRQDVMSQLPYIKQQQEHRPSECCHFWELRREGKKVMVLSIGLINGIK